MKPGIDPTTDFVFKRLFGEEDLLELSVDLLNAVVDRAAPGKRVRTTTLHNPISEREHAQDKQSIYDIRLSDQAARRFLLEMQRLGQWFFPKRALFYAASEYSRQLQAGEEYVTLQPVFVIGFTVRSWVEEMPWHQTFELRERTTGKVLGDMEIHFIHLDRFKLRVEEISTALERWAYFLQHAMELDTEALPATLDVPAIRKAMEVLMRIRENETDFDFYTRRRQEEIERATQKYVSEHAHELGVEEGLEKGLEQGLEKGEMVGMIRAFQEVLKQPMTPAADLVAMPQPALAALLNQLRKQVLPNGA